MFFKRMLVLGTFLVSMAMAQDESTFIRNICDSLPMSTTPEIKLKLAYVDETVWHGEKNMESKDSSRTRRIDDFRNLRPQRDYFPYWMPYSVTAGCRELNSAQYVYGVWSKPSSAWSIEDGNNNFSTYIMDIHGHEIGNFNEDNAYNLLALKQGGLPEDGEYSSGELLVSKTYEFQFDWWFASVVYKIVNRNVVIKDKDTTVTESYSYRYGASIGMDSALVVGSARNSLDIPDSISKVDLQVFHAVLMDERKIPKIEDHTEAIAELKASAHIASEERQIRRLDGSVVSNKEPFIPGIYYVKTGNGAWRKQIVLPR